MGLIHQVVITCIHMWDFPLVCSLCFGLCVKSHITPCPWPGFFVCLFVGWFECFLCSLQSLGYFLECGPLENLWGFIKFLCPVCDFLLRHLIHISILFLLSWGKRLLSHSGRYWNAPLCLIIKNTAENQLPFLSLKNGRPGAGRCNLIHLYGELYFRDQWHVRNLPALSAEMHFGFRVYICYVHKCFPSLVSYLCIHFSSGTRNYSRFSGCL